MAINDEQFQTIVQLIEDGELDDRMLDLQRAIDDRNSRRKEDILRLVKSVWGHEAQIVTDQVIGLSGPVPPGGIHVVDRERPARAAVEYTPDDGPAIPQGSGDALTRWPTPIEGQNGGGGGATFSPVRDPISESGGPDPYGDNNPDIVSTGAQI